MTAREQARDEALPYGGIRGREVALAAADAASDVWEPLVKELLQSLLVFDRTAFIDPALRRSAAQARKEALRKAEEALG